MSEIDYRRELEIKLKEPDNRTCIDCNTRNPKWVSTRYGTFMCLECAGKHRSLGVYLDFIKSVSLDGWDRESFLPVEFGGNKKFRDFIKKEGIEIEEYKKERVIRYSKELKDEIFEKTGVEVKASQIGGSMGRGSSIGDKSSMGRSSSIGRSETTGSTGKSGSTSVGKSAKAAGIPTRDTGANYSSSNRPISDISSSTSSLLSSLKDYSSKVSTAVMGQAKNLIKKGSEVVSTMKKGKQEEKMEFPIIRRGKPEHKDWS